MKFSKYQTIECGKTVEEKKKIMSACWKTLADIAEEINSNQVTAEDDRCALDKIEQLRKKSDESHRMRNMLSKDSIERLKKEALGSFAVGRSKSRKNCGESKKPEKQRKTTWKNT